jgi:tetratricopeptide (TPR) repeat protein
MRKTIMPFSAGSFASLLLAFGLVLIETGCRSSEAPNANVVQPPEETVTSIAPERPPAEVDNESVWAKLAEAAKAHIEAGEFDDAQKALDDLAQVYAEPEQPSDEQQDELNALSKALADASRAHLAERRAEQIVQAQQLLDSGKLVESMNAVNAVRAMLPTEAEIVAATKIETEIERIRGARRRLQTWMQLLGSSERSDVRSAQSQLAQDPATALTMLTEALEQSDDPVLVANSLETLRRLNRPEVVLPAMIGVLERPGQRQNWEDAAKQIVLMKQPGTGDYLLDMIVAAELPEQRAVALDTLTKVADPPQRTAIALLPMVYQDGPHLTPALNAVIHAINTNRQNDLIARRGLDVQLTPESEDLLTKLLERLAQIVERGSNTDPPSPEAYAAKALAIATRQLEPRVLEGVTVISASAEAEDGPAAAVLDGVWNSVELTTMWRHPAIQPARPELPFGTIVLDLGEERTVTAVRIWNFNETGGTLRGWKEVEVFVSTERTALTPIAHGIVPVAPGISDPPDYSINIPVDLVRGRYVKLKASSLWAAPNVYAGLSEVQVLGF